MASFARTQSLSRLLFTSTLIAALLPAGLLGGWIVLAMTQESPADDPETNRALAEALVFSDALERWFEFQELELHHWGETPAVVDGVRRAAVEHQDLGYTEEKPEEVNAQMVHKRHLGLATPAEEYLAAQVEQSEAWAQVHFSDEYGFTVGVAGLEEDFVQTDETWWQTAWSRGHYEGGIAFNENVDGYGLHLALHIEDPATEVAVGVIDGVLAMSAIQSLADEFTHGGRSSIRILSDRGQLIAETGSGHARDRIMRLSAEALVTEAWRAGVGAQGHSGGSRAGGVERGWARLAAAQGPPRDWIVVVERKTAGGGAILPAWSVAAGGIGLALLLGIGGAAWQRGRIVLRTRRLAQLAERFSEGDVSEAATDPGDDEIAELAHSLERLRGTSARAIQIIARQRRSRSSRRQGG